MSNDDSDADAEQDHPAHNFHPFPKGLSQADPGEQAEGGSD